MSCKLLLVEDNPVDTRVFEQMLGLSGVEISGFRAVTSVSASKNVIESFVPDIIFLDLALEDSTGVNTYERLQQLSGDTPVIILTANEEERVAIEILRLGAQDYLLKSVLSPLLISRSILYAMERSRMQKELLRSKANNEALIENTKDGIWAIDVSGNFITINSRFRDNFRLFCGQTPSEGDNMISMIPVNYRDWFTEIFRNALNGEQFRVETKLAFEDMPHHIELSVNPIKTAEGKVTGVSFFARNINQRKITEQRIRKSEHGYRLLLETINEGIVFIDNDNLVRFANSKFTAITGMEESFLTGKEISSFYAPNDPFHGKNMVAGLLKEENPVEITFITGDGNTIWFRIKGTPLMDEDGQVGGCLITHTEITAEKEAAETIRKHEQDYWNLLETMNEGLVHLERNGNVRFANQRFLELSGMSLQAICNKRLPHQLLPETLLDLIIEDNGRRSSPDNIYRYEIQVTTARHEKKWCTINCSVIKDGKGAFAGLLISYADITGHKSIEDKLQLAQRELNTFIYKSSHDLKGPLSSILGLINLMEKEEDLTKTSPCVLMIRKSAEKLDRMLNELLNVVRIKREKIYPEPIEFHSEIDEVLRSLQANEGYNFVRKDITIECTRELRTDRRLFAAIIQNLVDNAIRYRKPGNDSYVSIYIRDFMHGVKIEVEDNGKGFDEKTRGNIFTMFNRGNPESEGNGLGLYVVKNIIDRLGGYIEASVAENQNTRFTIFLPDLFSKEQREPQEV